MCGLLYAKLKKNNPDFSALFQQALQLLEYRGPDYTGFYQGPHNQYFGHTRLSILDLSDRSNQPVITDQYVLLFKGEIYNYKQLVPEVPSDTLAVAHLLTEGQPLKSQLNGMYGIVYYNKASDETTVLRDYYGEKPIYYYFDQDLFIVSSTIKSIVYLVEKTYGTRLNIDGNAVYEYFLSGFIREPKTIYQKIRTLSSGHRLTFANWQIKIDSLAHELLDKPQLSSTQHAINSLTTTDIEPSLLLSSGVDSTFILSLLNQYSHQFNVLTYKAPCNMIDESMAALQNLQKICGQKSIAYSLIENRSDLYNLYDEFSHFIEQPTTDGLNLFNILQLGRQNHPQQKLVLLGTGGDELFGGYPSFKNWRKVSLIRKLPFLKGLVPQKWQRFYALKSNQYPYQSYYFLYRTCPIMIQHVPIAIFAERFNEFVGEMSKYTINHQDPYHQIKTYETFDYMRNQLLRDADTISLYCGYEARNPLLSLEAFKAAPDNKQTLKKTIKNQHGIEFGHKRGFTFYSDRPLFQKLYQNVVTYNDFYKIFPNNLIKQVENINQSDEYLIKKMFNLLSWLNKNAIVPQQLTQFYEFRETA